MQLKAHIEDLMQDVDCEKRPMFGYPAYFINKNMFAGLFQDKLFLRLSPDQVTSLKKPYPDLGQPGAHAWTPHEGLLRHS